MSTQFYIGLAVGLAPWLLTLISIHLVKTTPTTGPTSNELLAERNAIGERQAIALEAIAECFREAAEMRGGDQ